MFVKHVGIVFWSALAMITNQLFFFIFITVALCSKIYYGVILWLSEFSQLEQCFLVSTYFISDYRLPVRAIIISRDAYCVLV